MVDFRKGDFLKAFSGLQSLYNVIPKKRRKEGEQKREGEGKGKATERSENGNRVFSDIVQKINMNSERIYKAISL